MLFSIIIPVYNAEAYLDECIESILKQTYSDFELILVDDGSKDSSPAMLDGYAACDDRVRVIHKPNGGQSTARNAGLAIATGEYIAHLDSDDFFLHDRVLTEIAEACAASPDIVAFKYKKYFDSTGEYGTCAYSFADIPTDRFNRTVRCLVEKDAFFCSAWSKVVRHSILRDHNIRFDEHSRCEDMDWYFNVILHSRTMALVDDVMVGYRQRSNSVTASGSVKTIDQFLTFFDVWTPRVDALQDEELREALRSALAKLFVNLMISYNAQADPTKKTRLKKLTHYAGLLKYNLNPRVRKIRSLQRLIGFRATMLALRVAVKMR